MGCPCPRHHLCLRWYLAWRNHHSRRPSYPPPTHHKISYHIIVNDLIIIRKKISLTCKSSGWLCLRHRMPRTRTRNTFFQTRLRWSLERSSSHGSTWERILGTYESEKKHAGQLLPFFFVLLSPAPSVEDVEVCVTNGSSISFIRKIGRSLCQGRHPPVKVVGLWD